MHHAFTVLLLNKESFFYLGNFYCSEALRHQVSSITLFRDAFGIANYVQSLLRVAAITGKNFATAETVACGSLTDFKNQNPKPATLNSGVLRSFS